MFTSKPVTPPLKIAESFGITFEDIDKVVTNACRSIQKAYSFMGCLTKDDIYSTAWVGALTAISKEKFPLVKNKLAYVFVFARGYITHDLHRKSRMIKAPWEDIKSQKAGTAHLSYSWDNLPEPSYVETEEDPLLELLDQLSESDKRKILRGIALSPEGQLVIDKIKNYGHS